MVVRVPSASVINKVVEVVIEGERERGEKGYRGPRLEAVFPLP